MSLYPFFDLEDYVNPHSRSYATHQPHHRASRLLDQHFGLGLAPQEFPALEVMTLPSTRCTRHNYLRPWRAETSKRDSGSVVSFDNNKFQVNLDVQQFKPEEITVKLTGENTVTIEGKHEETEDEHGFISQAFVRRYVLPKHCDAGQIQSKLSSDGVLTISAPTVDQKIEHKEIPIQQTGQPVKRAVEKKTDEKTEKIAED
uniref:Small heat shock protein 23 n=1 Tax=Gastrophysa atrocyanea TaxID=169758 RepID=Q3LGX1_GASAT|nr:small heat shock protein 23 [Gastrophysa atrocyanea]